MGKQISPILLNQFRNIYLDSIIYVSVVPDGVLYCALGRNLGPIFNYYSYAESYAAGGYIFIHMELDQFHIFIVLLNYFDI